MAGGPNPLTSWNLLLCFFSVCWRVRVDTTQQLFLAKGNDPHENFRKQRFNHYSKKGEFLWDMSCLTLMPLGYHLHHVAL